MRALINNSTELASRQIRKLISPSMRFELRERLAWLRELRGRACIWRWEIAELSHQHDKEYKILFAGRKSHRDLAKVLLGIDGSVDASHAGTDKLAQTAFVSEAPIPGALKVPIFLRVIIPLDSPMEMIASQIDEKLRRIIRNRRGNYQIKHAQNDIEIHRANIDLLQPYASARHGSTAAQLDPEMVRKIAQRSGRLDLVLKADELVGCILACETTQAQKRYWSLIRCGYSEEVFTDSNRLGEANAVNFYLALEWAVNSGYDYYDMGTCLGRPEDGLLQWKKRWGWLVDTVGNHGYLYVRLPRTGAAQFLWDTPLFSVERDCLTLHLGLPNGQSDEDFSSRYRKMGIDGLFKVRLHCTKPPSESLLKMLSGLYAHQKSPPIVETSVSG